MNEVVRTTHSVDEQIKQWLADYVGGGEDRTEECLRLGAEYDWVPEAVAKARERRRQADAEEAFYTREPLPPRVTAKAAAEQTVIKPRVAEASSFRRTKRTGVETVAAAPRRNTTAEAEPDPAAVEGRPTAGPCPELELPKVATGAKVVELLNRKHAVIGNYAGKAVILSWERWEIRGGVIVPVFQGFEDFRRRYMNRFVGADGYQGKSAGDYWLRHPERLQYEGVAYEPGGADVLEGRRLNLWRNFAVVAKRGCWDLLRDHIYGVLANGDRDAGNYIINWLAWALQNPGRPAEAVLAFQGEEGAGKSTLSKAMIRIFGPHALSISNPKLLTGDFSGHLHYCSFLSLEEAFWAGDQAAKGQLKSLITDDTITIHPKYGKPFPARNCLHIMMTSNSDWIVPADHGARRYVVFRVSGERVGNHAYFKALNDQMDAGGVAAMMSELLGWNLGEWHPKRIYLTAALMEQKQESLGGLDAWAETLLQEGVLPGVVLGYPNRSLSEDLLETAKAFDRYTNKTLIAKKLQALGMIERDFNIQVRRGWIFRPLLECRKSWETRNGGSWPWHRSATEWGKGEETKRAQIKELVRGVDKPNVVSVGTFRR
jgi:Family of unknown function (DUF5906)